MKRASITGKSYLTVWVMIFFWAVTMPAQAQTQSDPGRKISGSVTAGETGTPVPGASITIKGTKRMTTTDGAGNFSIPAAPGEVINIASMGFITREFKVGNSATVNVVMQEDYRKLNDVVVVGYGKMKKTDQSSAQVSITSTEVNRTINTTIDQAIQGRAAGVYVTQNSGQPGGGISVNIRGVNTLSGTNEPLYVIDGVQMQPATVSYGATSSVNPLAGINPSDIESLEILQGPSATAVYGSRATNGVILVTTKRGKSGQMKLSYNYLYSLQDKPEAVNTMTLQQFAIMNNEIAQLLNRTPTPEFQNPGVLGKGTNWQDALFRTASLQKHQVNISGGASNTTYYMSGEYFDQEGVAIGSDFNRYSFRLNLDNQAFKWLKLSTSLNFYQTKEKLASTSEDVIRNAINLAPNIPVKNADGSWGGATENEYGSNAKYAPLNPVAIASLVSNDYKRTGGLGGATAEISIIKGLTFRTSFNGNFEYTDGSKFIPTYQLGYNVNEKASLAVSNGKNFYWNLNELLQYSRDIGKHSFSVMVSHEAQAWNYQGFSAQRVGFASNSIPSLNLGNALGQTTGSYKGSGALESYLGRVNYTYDNKYIVQLAGRADGSSNFGADDRWGYFPSVSVAWRLTGEEFMKSLPFINELKIRAEYGTTGNNGSGGAQFSSLTSVTTPWGAGFRTGQYGNSGLKWESTETKNIGFNMSVLKDRIQLEGDFYIKKTDNLLMPNPLPAYMGTQGEGAINAPIVNIGAMQNKGFGITLNTVNIDNKQGFSWRTNFNISSFKTKITKFYSDAAFLSRSAWFMNNFTSRSVIGDAPWQFYGYVAEGLFQSVDEINSSAIPAQSDGTRLPVAKDGGVWVGDIKYKDLNGDNIIDSRDQTFIGNPWPKLTFGLTNTFSWKGFDLSVLMTAAQGNDIFNYLRFENTNPNNINLGRNLLQESFNYARVGDVGGKTILENPGANVPRIVGTDVNGNGNRFTNLYVEDGSYIRIKNVQLGYNIPHALLRQQSVVKNIRLIAGVQNLATFTKYKGYDPEVGSYLGKEVQLSSQLIGVDAGRYPLTRLYSASVAVDF
ncbi:SusC/RagA family TonB-linked outer membrane protein [Chitinophaga pinensis]|uniref:TonB-dependent receptor n=1 Tax=Chitinophaga pinensis (strain ATCC 43595 / DSM 2588 / LMG 13176 / NBRC 15968 / NCIMB 11800 / UQM 2034) TaxID=485918 RepID=A0A979GTG6_CHIPD|nr:TonB-dependent receptor [Chitinophaga pinensis]ACU63772.1 TonB-dependent receptor [Chitinophaga pinensis DSM 2588]